MREHGELAAFEPIGMAISMLLHPHAEVVLHDLRTGRIDGIWNAFSTRRVGDASLIDDDLGGELKVLGPYAKTGVGGERLRSVTAVLGDDEGRPIGLLCINLDVTRIEEASRFLQALIAPPKAQPGELFGRDWRERMQATLHAWLRERSLALSALTRAERVELIGALEAEGLFETRNAADHAARLLGISRSSLYNHLRAARAGVMEKAALA